MRGLLSGRSRGSLNFSGLPVFQPSCGAGGVRSLQPTRVSVMETRLGFERVDEGCEREGRHPLRDFQFLKEVYGHRNEENCPLYIKDVFRTVNRATSCGKLCDSPCRRIIRRVLPRLGWSRPRSSLTKQPHRRRRRRRRAVSSTPVSPSHVNSLPRRVSA